MYNPYSNNQNNPSNGSTNNDHHSPNGTNPTSNNQPPGIPTQSNSNNNGQGLNDFSSMSNALPNYGPPGSQGQSNNNRPGPIGPPGSRPAGAIGQPPGHGGNNSGGSGGSSGGVGAIGQPPAANAPPGYNNMGPGGDQGYGGPPSNNNSNNYTPYGGGSNNIQTGYNPGGYNNQGPGGGYHTGGGGGYNDSYNNDPYGPGPGGHNRGYNANRNQGGYNQGGGYNPHNSRMNQGGGYNPHGAPGSGMNRYGPPGGNQGGNNYGPPGGYGGQDPNMNSYGSGPGAIGQGPQGYNPYSNSGQQGGHYGQPRAGPPGSGPIGSGPIGAIGGPPNMGGQNSNSSRGPPPNMGPNPGDRYGASSVNSNPQERDSGSNINSPPFNRGGTNPDDSSISPPDMHGRSGRGLGDLSLPGGRSTHSNSSGDNVSTSGASGRGTMPTRPPTRPDQPASLRGDTPPESVAGSIISGNRENSFKHPLRPSVGRQGKTIMLKANFFRVEMPNRDIYHYEVDIKPDKCPRRVNREIVNEMVKEYKDSVFAQIMPVYDGRRNMYTTCQMPIERNGHTLDVKLPSDGRERSFQCTLKFKTKISLYNLKLFLDAKVQDVPFPLEAITALDVVMRHLPSMKYTPVGRSFFSQPVGNHPQLGGGREVWFGFHQSMRPSQWKMMLNIDVSATAFYKSQPVIKFLAEVLELRSEDDLLNIRQLTDAQRIKFAKEIRGLKVEINHCGAMKRKYRVCHVTRRCASQQTFPLQEDNGSSEVQHCTVQDYFQARHELNLRYPQLPCLQVGQEAKHTYLPLEVCNVVGGQRCIKKLTDSQTSTMIRATARSAPDREVEISNLVKANHYNNDPYVKEFGLQVIDDMTEIRGRVISPPKLQYGGPQRLTATPSSGVWDMRNKQFYHGIEVDCWAIFWVL